MQKWCADERTEKPGRPDSYSDAANSLRTDHQSGFLSHIESLARVSSIHFRFIGLPLVCPHYSVFSRRRKGLSISYRKLLKPGEKLNVIFDSTAVKVFGKREWKVCKLGYGKRRTWRKNHIDMDADTGQIVVGTISEDM